MASARFSNPYRPGAGHMPTYLAGRDHEKDEFLRVLKQETILENVILTGLRGVGKTVLLESLKPLAIKDGWLWVGTDLSESASISEERLAVRLMTDMAVVTSSVIAGVKKVTAVGFAEPHQEAIALTFPVLVSKFQSSPGLVSDKLKSVLELVWESIRLQVPHAKGIIFAYDEAQNMSDHAAKNEYPLSLMLDVFQSIQKKDIPFMLVLTGLPTLFPKLVEARTYSERMFHVLTLDKLDENDSRDAIEKPISDSKCPVKFTTAGINAIVENSGGYPYFIQFICREFFDAYLQKLDTGNPVLISQITRKLDSDFFMGRWSRATDRQRQLLAVIASLPHCENEFTVQEVAEKSEQLLEKAFGKSQTNRLFLKLSQIGLVYKNRHGKYAFAVPLLGQFIMHETRVNGPWWDEATGKR